MTGPELENITFRLIKLERQNRYMKLAVVSIAILLAVLLLVKPGGMLGMVPYEIRADRIRADRIVVVDSEGRERIVMKAESYGVAAVNLMDSNGIDRAFMHSSDYSDNGGFRGKMSGGLIGIGNRKGEHVVLLHADTAGHGVVGAYYRNGKGKELKPEP